MSEGFSLGSILLNSGPGEWQGEWLEFDDDDIYRSMWEKEAIIEIRSKVSSFMGSENN